MLFDALISVALVLAATAPKTEVVEKRYPDGTLKLRREVMVDASGRQTDHGKVTRYWSNGKPQEEITYVEGQKSGPWTEWYESGLKKAECGYRRGVKHGSEVFYNKEGKKYFEA